MPGSENARPTPPRLDVDLTRAEPVPPSGIARATELMESGRLFRYQENDHDESDDASELESRIASLVGRRYAVAVNSCGSAMFLALRASGVAHGDKVLVNGYTLAPVPGAIDHVGAIPVLVEINDDLTIDLDDLRQKAQSTGAATLLLSHMRGHLADLDAVVAVCRELGIVLIEDCAHTMGARWNGRPTGQFGRIGCFSTQTFKHLNSGEGGLLVTDDDEIAARAILHSGSYMLYPQHRARPPLEIFEPLRGHVANYSLRMSALAAAVVLPQLDLLPERIKAMNRLYRNLEIDLRDIPHVRVIDRPDAEQFVGSSFQFALPELDAEQISVFVSVATELGLPLKWFGEIRMRGFTSRPQQWEWVEPVQRLPRTEAILATLCELRLPPSMTIEQCRQAADVIRFATRQATSRPARSLFPIESVDLTEDHD